MIINWKTSIVTHSTKSQNYQIQGILIHLTWISADRSKPLIAAWNVNSHYETEILRVIIILGLNYSLKSEEQPVILKDNQVTKRETLIIN